jgi:hypothetical protein
MMTWPGQGVTQPKGGWTLCSLLSLLALWSVGSRPFRCTTGGDHTLAKAGTPETWSSVRAGVASAGPHPPSRSSAPESVAGTEQYRAGSAAEQGVVILLSIIDLHGQSVQVANAFFSKITYLFELEVQLQDAL